MALKYNVCIDKWGNSQGIRIPKKIFQRIGIKQPVGQKMKVNVNNGSIVISKSDNHLSDIDRLFKGFDYKKYNSEVRRENGGTLERYHGPRVGKEMLP